MKLTLRQIEELRSDLVMVESRLKRGEDEGILGKKDIQELSQHLLRIREFFDKFLEIEVDLASA